MQKQFEPSEVLRQYPWLGDNTPQNIIMGDDLDAALGTLLYLRHNPSAQLVGVYSGYQRIWYRSDLRPEDLQQCVYLDLDICGAGFRSLGHHIVRLGASDRLDGFRDSFNPNEWIGRSVQHQFNQKYPLGTVHLLLWLYNTPIPDRQYAEQLIWLADSAFINGQSHRFRANVLDWAQHLLPCEGLQRGLQHIDTTAFEDEMAALQQLMHQAGLPKGSGQAVSRFKGLTGFQCQPSSQYSGAEMVHYLQHLQWFLSSITGWHITDAQWAGGEWTALSGTRHSGQIAAVLRGRSLDTFLAEEGVFSYVFPFKHTINYTVIPHGSPQSGNPV